MYVTLSPVVTYVCQSHDPRVLPAAEKKAKIPRGTRPVHSTVSFDCPGTRNSMKRKSLKRCRWQAAAPGLSRRLAVDHRNHLKLADPWSRAAHSMVESWRN